jgi:hypothetical protein
MSQPAPNVFGATRLLRVVKHQSIASSDTTVQRGIRACVRLRLRERPNLVAY